ncbi:MAG TPA: hypothetical protein VJH33_00030 [Candidatus Paceibacterota bacterium]
MRTIFPSSFLTNTVFLVFFMGIVMYVVPASASVSGPIEGYAWSENIGWISLNGSNYGLTIGSGGTISGYAWSDNIGWISANESDLSGCPSNPCRAKLNGNSLTGWLKALAGGGTTSGGWDGWISLSGSNYGVTESGGVFSGYAWGSDVVGWIDFSFVTPNAPSCSLSASPTSVAAGQSSTLSWSSTNATSCTGVGFSTGGATSGSQTVSPTQTTDYGATCAGSGGSATCLGSGGVATTSIAVSCTTAYSCSGSTIQYTDAACAVSTVTTCVSPNYCSTGSAVCLTPTASGSISTSPVFTLSGDTVVVSWNVTNAVSCSVSGTNGDSWGGTSGSQTSSPITEFTTFTLACDDGDADTVQDDLTDSTSVLNIPMWFEL